MNRESLINRLVERKMAPGAGMKVLCLCRCLSHTANTPAPNRAPQPPKK
jgi:hypothetical protein